MGQAKSRFQIHHRVDHDSRFLWRRLKQPLAGEEATIKVEMRNRSIVDVPATNYEILIHWANGAWTKSLLRQSLDPILRSDSDDESRTRGVLGPFPFAVQARGRATIYLRMDPWPPPNLEGVQGQPITHDTANNLIRLGGFTATSRELLYLKASIVIGLLTLLAVVSIPLLFP